MICVLYGSDQTSCVAYVDPDMFTAFIVAFVILWATYQLFKFLFRLMGF